MGRAWDFFRVAYTSVYFLLYILLAGLLLITPADAIGRSLRNNQVYNIWLLAFTYVLTILVVSVIYFIRLYVNKTVLNNIPKPWVPIDVGDVTKAVHQMIQDGLDRSAAIAYEARPRTEPDGVKVTIAAAEGLGISKALQHELWDGIEHKGWSSPKSPDLPNLHYGTVLAELPNLIEAKAMTLAQRGPATGSDVAAPDSEAVSLLQRSANLSLRGYADHLASLDVLSPDETVTDFLALYEYARFSTQPISNAQFRELMHLFAEVLRSMQPLDLAILHDDETAPSESAYGGGDGDDSRNEYLHALANRPDSSDTSSIRRPAPRSASWGGTFRTAPTTPRSRPHLASRPSSSSGNSFAQTRRPYDASSSSSIRSGRSWSVIRLATREDDEDLPYVLNLMGTAESI
ncbi:sucrase/ferredoxin domain-containing protein [Emericellopsis atlantica]|uniref:Defect at low temperature protein 1 n=1 Tax=Emericellopsis atlantica TaxID=2614577 RepID=A0A9P7ZSN7_9HYPO|nr:sucrase/ferredoxin domain-containing protein [Emericellopsis atlantica]KAG9257589.1 sucrase/ferredoxin domain-containing protein [Emericellopsis atlantica]